MTLTEQWKKGELESGVYYIKYRGAYKVDQWHGYYWEDSWSENIEEVIAPVPSYEEWQELKELLKECRDFIGFCTPKCFKTSMERLLTKIGNAIGEKNNGN